MRRALPLLIVFAALAMPAPASAQIDVSCFAPALTRCNDVWHTQPVTIDWSIDPGYGPVGGCIDETIRFDTTGTRRTCDVASVPNGTDTASRGVTIMLDQTPPTVFDVTPSRPPDHNGWYRSPVRVRWLGDDKTSRVRACSSTTYSGPNAAAVDLIGRCRDNAGNVSAPRAFRLRYDSKPPTVTDLRATASDHTVRLRWNVPDGSAVSISRTRAGGTPRSVFSGSPKGSLVDRDLRNGRTYRYDLTATDPAGNVARRTLTIAPGPRLLAPANGARVGAAPLLRWTKVRGADYYNVQLFRGGRKLLSAWPTKARLQLDRKWRYAGRRHRLKDGRRYRWFVWPGHGPRARGDYGRLIGTSTFTMGAT